MSRHLCVATLGGLMAALVACESAEDLTGDSSDTQSTESASPIVEGTPVSERLALPPETLVSELSDEDFLSFCSETLTQLGQLKSLRDDPKYACVGEGLYARYAPDSGGDVSTCEDTRQSCLDSAEVYVPPEAITCDESYLADGAQCTISLGEYEDCLQGILDTMEMIEAMLDCEANFEEALELQALYVDASPGRCDPIEEKCALLAETLP